MGVPPVEKLGARRSSPLPIFFLASPAESSVSRASRGTRRNGKSDYGCTLIGIATECFQNRLGSTGYQPVLAGNLPDSFWPLGEPVGKLPTGTGKLPMLPFVKTRRIAKECECLNKRGGADLPRMSEPHGKA